MEVQKEESGRLLRGYINMDDVIAVPSEWLAWSAHSSPVWFLGSHCFDMVRYISGQEVKSVYAVGQKRLLASKGLDTWDSVQSTLLMEDGSSWVIENSWVLPAAFPKDNDGRMAVLCDNAWIRSIHKTAGWKSSASKRLRPRTATSLPTATASPAGLVLTRLMTLLKR
jgi:predicted dehydrogenase